MTDVLTNGTFWAGVVGVVGIVATLLAPLMIEHRRERVERRRATRLIIGELHQIQSAAEFIVHYKEPPEAELLSRMFSRREWEDHRGSLAAHVSKDTWFKAMHLYQLLDGLPEALAADTGTELANSELAVISETAQLAREVRDELDSLR